MKEDKIKEIIIKLELENKTNYLEDVLIGFIENIPDSIHWNRLDLLMKVLGGITILWNNHHKPLSEQSRQLIDFIYKYIK